MTSCYFKLAKEYVSIAQVTVCPPLSRLIPKLFSDEKTLSNNRVHSTVRSGLTGNTGFTLMRHDKNQVLSK